MRVPQYKSGTQQTAEVGGQRFTVQASPAASSVALGALGSLAETATNIAFDFYEKEKKIQDESQITDLSNEYRLGVQDLFEQSKLQDPEVQDSWFNENEKKLRGQIIGRSGNRRVRNALTNDTDNVYTSIFPTVRKFANTRRIDKRLAGAFEKAQLLIRDSADPESKALRNRAYTELLGNPELGITGLYDQLQEENLISATDALELITKAKNEISRNRIFAEFNQLRTISQKNAYIKNLQDYIPEGLDNEDVRSIANSLGVEVRRQQSQYNAVVKGVRDSIKNDMKILERGGVVPPERIDLLRRQVGATGDAVAIAQLERFEILNSAIQETNAMTPSQIRDEAANLQVAGIKNQGGEGADTSFELDLRDTLNKKASYLESEIEKNPLNAAINTRLVDGVPRLDFTNEKTTNESLYMRYRIDDIVSNTYGLPPGSAFFRAGEVESLTQTLAESDNATKLSILSSVVQNSGNKAPVVIESISEEDSSLGYAAVLIKNDRPSTANKVLNGKVKREQQEPTIDKIASSSAEFSEIGSAFALQPKARAQVVEAAKSIYAEETFGTEKYTNFNEGVWKDSLQKASGKLGKFGGVQEVFDAKTIIPPTLTSDRIEDAIENIADDEFTRLGTTAQDARAGSVSEDIDIDKGLIEEVRDGDFNLMNAGGSDYYFYKGEYGTNDFRLLQDTKGRSLVFNIETLVEIYEVERDQ